MASLAWTGFHLSLPIPFYTIGGWKALKSLGRTFEMSLAISSTCPDERSICQRNLQVERVVSCWKIWQVLLAFKDFFPKKIIMAPDYLSQIQTILVGCNETLTYFDSEKVEFFSIAYWIILSRYDFETVVIGAWHDDIQLHGTTSQWTKFGLYKKLGPLAQSLLLSMLQDKAFVRSFFARLPRMHEKFWTGERRPCKD